MAMQENHDEVSSRPWRFDPRPHKHSLGMILDAAGAPVCSFGGDNLSTGEQYAGFAPDDADVEFMLNAVNAFDREEEKENE